MTEMIQLASCKVKLDGQDLSPELYRDVEECTVEMSLHQAAMATLRIFDPTLRWVDTGGFQIGAALKVSFQQHAATGSPVDVFDGEIVEVEAVFDEQTVYLIVRAFDRLHRLDHGQATETFLNVTDSDVASTLAGAASLSFAGESTSEVFPYLIRVNETALNFLRRRAALNGRLLYVEGTNLYMNPLSAAGSVALAWSQSLVSFRPRISTARQVNQSEVRSWNVQNKEVILGSITSTTVDPAVGESRSQWFGSHKTVSSRLTIPSQAMATTVAQGRLEAQQSSFIEAEALAIGTPSLVPGVTATISDVGTRFSGDYLVTSATHRYQRDEGYYVEFQVSGMQPELLLRTLAALPAEIPLGGLVPAIVTNIDDPQAWGRVKVALPWLGDTIESDWARVLSVGGGPNRGVLFTPEVNDEVLVGMLQNDLTQLFVLGGLWNGSDAPPIAKSVAITSGAVVKRVIKSRDGHIITLDDTDNTGGITLADKNNNFFKITIEQDEITISAAGDISLSAGGDIHLAAQNINLKAQQNIALESTQNTSIDATQNVAIKGMQNVDIEATVELKAKGTAGATIDGTAKLDLKSIKSKLEGSAMVEVQGGLIKLN